MLNPKLPKAELHVHIECATWPDKLRALAEAQARHLPKDIFSADGRHYAHRNFSEFHHLYDMVASVLTSPQAYETLIYDYLSSLASEHTIYSEIFLSPDHAKICGISYTTLLTAAITAIDRAQKDWGIMTRIVIPLVRHLGPKVCANTLQIILQERHPYVRGITLVGDVVQYPLKDFATHFDQAAAKGLGCSAHIGETRHDLEIPELYFGLAHLPITRIGHGIRAAEDPDIMDLIVEQNITLEICPSSNLILKMCDSFATHPLHILKKRGIKFTLNTDDPPLFDTTLGKEYQIGYAHFGLTETDLQQVTRHAIEASFAEAELKLSLLRQLS